MTAKSTKQLQLELSRAEEYLRALNDDLAIVRNARERIMLSREIEQQSILIASLEALLRERLGAQTDRLSAPNPEPVIWELDAIVQAEAGDLLLNLSQLNSSWRLSIGNRATRQLTRLHLSFAESQYLKVRGGRGVNNTDIPEISVLNHGQHIDVQLEDVVLYQPSHDTLRHEDNVALRDAMHNAFDITDLQFVVSTVDSGGRVDWDDLEGTTKSGKLISLLEFWRMQQRSYLGLLDACIARNPNGPWMDLRRSVRMLFPLTCNAAYLMGGLTQRYTCNMTLTMTARR